MEQTVVIHNRKSSNTCSTFIANLINKLHLLVISYVIFGFMLPDILIFNIPLFLLTYPIIEFHWFILNENCILTIIESYFRDTEPEPFSNITVSRFVAITAWLIGLYQYLY